MIKKKKSLSISNVTLTPSTFVCKFFLNNQWHFDILTKTNGSLNSKISLPANFNTIVTLPLVSTQSDSITKLKFLLYSLKLIWFFTFQKSFIQKKLILQQQKKKNSCYVLQSKSINNYATHRFFYYLLTIIPYMVVSYGYDRNILISDTRGSINLTTNDISFFSSFLEEKIIGWDRQITIVFNWNWKKTKLISKKQKFFLLFLPVWGLMSWILWSSLGLTCDRGHGGWLPFSKFSKTILYSNKDFFQKNFKF